MMLNYPNPPKVQFFRGQDQQWYVRLRGANNRTVFITEGYSRRWNAKRAARQIARAFDVVPAEIIVGGESL